MFGHVIEEVPGHFFQRVRTEVDVSCYGAVQGALHLACSCKCDNGWGVAPNGILIGRYIEDVVYVGHPCPIRRWVARCAIGWLLSITLDTSLQVQRTEVREQI